MTGIKQSGFIHEHRGSVEVAELWPSLVPIEDEPMVLWDVWFGGDGTDLFVDETQTITFFPDVPGTYIYVCAIPGHAA